jgi:four helix bundle protein
MRKAADSEGTPAKIQSFTGLIAWQEAHTLVIMIYRFTSKFPESESFGLTNQLRRAVISITSNIAEGFSRKSFKEKIQFYSMALSSLTEVQNQILAARDVGLMHIKDFAEVAEQSVHVSKLINGLIKKSRTFLIPNS